MICECDDCGAWFVYCEEKEMPDHCPECGFCADEENEPGDTDDWQLLIF